MTYEFTEWLYKSLMTIFSLKRLGSCTEKYTCLSLPHISLFIKLLALVYNASNKTLSIYTCFCLCLEMTTILSMIVSSYFAGQIRDIIKQFIFLYKDV